MAGILKVDKYQDFNGNDIMTSDGAGNLTLNNSAMKNTPAFEAYLSSNQVINDNTNTKIQFDTEVYDTDNCYDNSSNYRFTPTTAGKYFIYSQLYLDSTAGNMRQVTSKIYKNGGELVFTNVNFDNNYGEGAAVTQSAVVDLNGSSDYIEIFGNPDTVDNGTAEVNGGASERFSLFGAYKLIGA